MKYLFFDIECADGGKATICSFGYVIADMNFNVIKHEDIIINPEAKFNVTGRKGRPDVEFAYPKERFLKAPTFDHFHNKIKALLEDEEHYVIGHSVGDDVKYLAMASLRYNLPPMKFEFFDTQKMYRDLSGDKKHISLENAILSLGLKNKITYHRSDEDARATMLVLKELLVRGNTTFEEYASKAIACTGKTFDFKWGFNNRPIEAFKDARQTRGGRSKDFVRESKPGWENFIMKGTQNHKLFLRFLDYGMPIGEGSDWLLGKKVSVSLNYEQEHYREMLNLVGMIKAAGGEYTLKASQADVFATFDYVQEDGTIRYCSRSGYVEEAISEGKAIKIMKLSELLEYLGTSLEALSEMPKVNTDYLLDEQYSKRLLTV